MTARHNARRAARRAAVIAGADWSRIITAPAPRRGWFAKIAAAVVASIKGE